MRITRTVFAALVAVLAVCGGAVAQEKAKDTAEFKPAVPMKVVVVLTEFDGEKKISSMPYTLSLLAPAPPRGNGSLRMGLKVPILTRHNETQSDLQYMDVGTDIDARVEPAADGRFQLSLQVRRSSVHTLEGANKEVAWNTGEGSGRPILRSFSTGFDVLLRDGQSAQPATATDPVSGRVLKVEVTLNVVK